MPRANSRDLNNGLSNLQATKPLLSGPNSIMLRISTTATPALPLLLPHVLANANLGGWVGVHLSTDVSVYQRYRNKV